MVKLFLIFTLGLVDQYKLYPIAPAASGQVIVTELSLGTADVIVGIAGGAAFTMPVNSIEIIKASFIVLRVFMIHPFI
jgi:hypothetical protein